MRDGVSIASTNPNEAVVTNTAGFEKTSQLTINSEVV